MMLTKFLAVMWGDLFIDDLPLEYRDFTMPEIHPDILEIMENELG